MESELTAVACPVVASTTQEQQQAMEQALLPVCAPPSQGLPAPAPTYLLLAAALAACCLPRPAVHSRPGFTAEPI